MKLNLSEVEIRVVGALIEKELTTPENYPLSLNSLTNACNQKSNRSPVMELAEEEVVRALDRLGARGFARLTAAGGRVAKYRHSLEENLKLKPQALALLAELMLRGPQTASELRARVERMVPVAGVVAVEESLGELMNYGPPLVARLPRQPGQKEQRYVQLLSGQPQSVADQPRCDEEPVPQLSSREERLARLDEEVTDLRSQVAALRGSVEQLFAAFR